MSEFIVDASVAVKWVVVEHAQMISADRRFAAKLAGSDLARHVTLLSDWQTA